METTKQIEWLTPVKDLTDTFWSISEWPVYLKTPNGIQIFYIELGARL